ncbi:glycerol dehydrogenase [Lachnospiraceae bacterium]|nr:glycerol dehydrogenase [Lachnospiraceae bacterium]
MLTIKAPETYINEYGILAEAGKYISVYGKKALIIAGKTAWSKVEKELEKSLEEWNVISELMIMEGYPVYDKIQKYASFSDEMQSDLVIGIGGGKICDAAKAVGDLRNIPVVIIPTIAATCACWASRSILYKNDGNFDLVHWNKKSPVLILSDTQVLKEAPKRYLASGIMDTFAKWYEFEPLIEKFGSDLTLLQNVATAKVAFDLLKELGTDSYFGKTEDDLFKKVVDAIFYLAGASGSFSDGKPKRGFAHPYYFASTRIAESRHMLHGEKVAFGLLVQFILKGKDDDYINKYIDELLLYGLVETPEDWESTDPDRMILRLSEILMDEWPVVAENGFAYSDRDIEEAIHEACRRIRSVRDVK